MIKLKFILIILIFFINIKNIYANSVKIIVKVENEIITNIDIENEKKYLIFLNPKLKELDNSRINNIAKNSLINEIIKKKEIKKFFDFEKSNNLTNIIRSNLMKKRKINNETELLDLLKKNNLKYQLIEDKLKVEALWNQLIYNKYSKNIKVDKNNLKKLIIMEFNEKRKKFEYNLSEIVVADSIDENLASIISKLGKSINEIGFENTANIYSISNSSKNGGYIGWVNELQISEIIKKSIRKLGVKEISKPIKIDTGYLFIKLIEKREFNQEINIEYQLNQLVNKETSRQLNNYSNIFFKRLMKNTEINEL